MINYLIHDTTIMKDADLMICIHAQYEYEEGTSIYVSDLTSIEIDWAGTEDENSDYVFDLKLRTDISKFVYQNKSEYIEQVHDQWNKHYSHDD